MLAALGEVVLDELANAEKVRIGGLVQVDRIGQAGAEGANGRKAATGKETSSAAKPASVDLRARPPAPAPGALPSVQKARRRLAV